MDETAKNRWHNMLVAAYANRTLSPEEAAYIESMRKELGITEAAAQDIAANIRSGKTSIRFKGSSDEKLSMLRDMVRVLWTDGQIDERERRMFDAVVAHLGLSEAQAEAILQDLQPIAKKGSGKNPAAKSAPEFSFDAADAPKAPAGPAPRVGDIVVHAKTGIEFVRVPEGRFIFGNPSVGTFMPSATGAAFAIARFPVTNAQWERFETATGHTGRAKPAQTWFLEPERPVVGVSFADAQAFCQWAGLRLPTEMEWEYAARGNDGRTYPWGGAFPGPEYANFGQNLLSRTHQGPLPVGTLHKGVSPFGVYDMTGNVAEWCIPHRESNNGSKPTRGGNWCSAIYALPTYYHDMVDPETGNERIGFRPAADLAILK